MDYTAIDELLDNNKELCSRICMNDVLEVKGVLRKLVDVLNNNIEGDVVELGCNNGGTSYWIKRVLEIYKSKKTFHVYDSWMGVPEKVEQDKTINYINNIVPQIGANKHSRSIEETVNINEHFWKKGLTATQLYKFKNTFMSNNMIDLPEIHSGWFSEIPDNEYPEKICFAYFDGDFYTSIMDSFNKVYKKMTSGGIIVIDDCGDNTLIGVRNACDDFLSDKPETLHLDAYPSVYGVWERKTFEECFWGGWIQKI